MRFGGIRTGGRKSESATRYPLSRFDHEYEGDKSRSLQTEFQPSRTIIKRVREEKTLFDVKSPKMHGFFLLIFYNKASSWT